MLKAVAMSLLSIIAKDLRLLWRDKAGLVFLTLAPVLVITVAGFSLANLYGADPTGQTAYDFPLADEDGGALATAIRTRLAQEQSIRVHPVPSRAAAKYLVESKVAGAALVIPQGTQTALERGQTVPLIVYTDAAKYLERLNVRTRMLELLDALAAEQRRRLGEEASAQRERLQQELERLHSAVAVARAKAEAAWQQARRQREQALATVHAAMVRAQRDAEAQITQELAAAAEDVRRDMARQIAEIQQPARAYLEALAGARQAFTAWLGELQRLAGSHATDIPPPPVFPEVPDRLRQLLADGTAAARLPPPPRFTLTLPPLRAPEIPAVPPPPALAFPDLVLPEMPAPPGALAIEEVNVSGAPATINTFDQNVPGFSVTFLLLGMLLGVSLGLLDERDWGTLDRLRSMPITASNILLGKLLARFVVGMLQMVALFAVGWLAFSISLGPQPWALLLPTAAIVFAGTAFGVIVAALTRSREAVLPVGSIVIVTMAAVGGCWWPIDLEPRWMRTAALALPTTWAMDAFNDLMIRRRSAGAAVLPTAIMVVYGVAYLAVGLVLFRRQLRRS